MRSPREFLVPRPGRSRWWALPRELLIVMTGVVVYFGVRGVTVGDTKAAMANAVDLVWLERDAGIYLEPELQGVINGSDAVMTFMNWIYIWGHWPVIIPVLVWLFMLHPDGYRETRNTMLLSGGIGLFVFALYPVAPPRLAGLGLIDTVTEYSTSYRVLQPPAFVNQYAAMPSLHVGWDLLIGIALFTWSSHLVVRAIGVVLPILMTLSVVLTANHYIIDAVAGIALVLVCRWLVRLHALRRLALRRRLTPALPLQRRTEPAGLGRPAAGRDPAGSDPAGSDSAGGDRAGGDPAGIVPAASDADGADTETPCDRDARC